MVWSVRSHSRLISWLKVILPIAAIGTLSTLFLIAHGTEPLTSTLPYSDIDLKAVARSQRITKPSFAGATENGDLIAFTADSATPLGDNQVDAAAPTARIDLTSGQHIDFSALQGRINLGANLALLQGKVVIRSSTGYEVDTEELQTAMDRLQASTPGNISGKGPIGTFTAGQMQLTTDTDTGEAYLVFTHGVDLLYDPSPDQE